MAARSRVLQLYKQILREGQKFSSYNYRMYAVRKTKDTFRSNKNVTDEEIIRRLIAEAESNLQMIRRQALLSQMYGHGKLIIESKQ